MVAPGFGGGAGLGVRIVGVVPVRILNEPCQQRAFLHIELWGALAEVELRRSLDAVPPAAEIDLVGVHLHDLFLGIRLLQLAGEDDLLQLAVQALLALGRDRADQLHGERGRALAPAPEAGHEIPARPRETPGRDAAVFPEFRILRGHQRIDEGLGDISIGNHHPVFLGEDTNDVAALVQHLGDGLRHTQGKPGEEAVGVAGHDGPGHRKGDGPRGHEGREAPKRAPDPASGRQGEGSQQGSHGPRIAVEWCYDPATDPRGQG